MGERGGKGVWGEASVMVILVYVYRETHKQKKCTYINLICLISTFSMLFRARPKSTEIGFLVQKTPRKRLLRRPVASVQGH